MDYLPWLLTGLLVGNSVEAADWAQWRGPHGTGIAATGPAPPTHWDDTRNVRWKVSIPGRGHSSPVVVDDRLFLTTADETAGTQSILALSRSSGEPLWQRTVLSTGTLPSIHKKNTHASATAACDGTRVFATFFAAGKIHLVCLQVTGQPLWQQIVAEFKPEYPFGYAASPILHQRLVIATAESESATVLVAYDRTTGQEVWRRPRPQNSSYSSPAILRVGGRLQLCISGGREVRAYDPDNGTPLWHAPAAAKHTAGTVTGAANYVLASGGYPQSETTCVLADGSGQVLWKNKQKCYEQSMLVHEEYVYAITDGGIAYCWDLRTGQERWKHRLEGPISSSPVLAGSIIYAFNERGRCFVYHATPTAYQEIARNQLGTDVFPTPTFLDGRIYARVGVGEEAARKERLYCLGSG